MRACRNCGIQPDLKRRKVGHNVYVQYRCPLCGRATGWTTYGNRAIIQRNWDQGNGGEQE